MDYRIVVTYDAKVDLEHFVSYLIDEKKSHQAAANLLLDYDETILELAGIAGSLKLCDNKKLKERGYRRYNFQRHRYFLLYRIEADIVYVDHIYHFLQDIDSRIK